MVYAGFPSFCGVGLEGSHFSNFLASTVANGAPQVTEADQMTSTSSEHEVFVHGRRSAVEKLPAPSLS